MLQTQETWHVQRRALRQRKKWSMFLVHFGAHPAILAGYALTMATLRAAYVKVARDGQRPVVRHGLPLPESEYSASWLTTRELPDRVVEVPEDDLWDYVEDSADGPRYLMVVEDDQDSSDSLYNSDLLRENHVLAVGDDSLEDSRLAPAVIDDDDFDAEDEVEREKRWLDHSRWRRVLRDGDTFAWDRVATYEDEGLFMAAAVESQEAHDPQLGRQARVIVKRSTHRKLADVAPHSDQAEAQREEMLALLLSAPERDIVLTDAQVDDLLMVRRQVTVAECDALLRAARRKTYARPIEGPAPATDTTLGSPLPYDVFANRFTDALRASGAVL